MNKYELRKKKLFELYEEHYRSQIDDFYDARDTFLKEFREVFNEEYKLDSTIVVLDDLTPEQISVAKTAITQLSKQIR